MKKILSLLLVSLALFSFTTSHQELLKSTSSYVTQKADSVYICNSTTSYAYHSSLNCRGLNRCTHGIIKVSLYDAEHKYGRRPCKICEY